MTLPPEGKRLIERIVNAFEEGTPDGDCGAISIYADGRLARNTIRTLAVVGRAA